MKYHALIITILLHIPWSHCENKQRKCASFKLVADGCRLKDSLIAGHKTDTIFECGALCFDQPLCESFNFQNVGHPKHICELNNSTMTCGSRKRVRDKDYNYYEPVAASNRKQGFGQKISVHGKFSDWNRWSACDVGCGNGTQNRTRTCTNPAPRHAGNNCIGDFNQTQNCAMKPCPIHGNFSDWGDWSACEHVCINGNQTRARNCSNPSPQYGGNNCTDAFNETRNCSMRPWCPKYPSSILYGEHDFIDQVLKWLGFEKAWRLCWRASRDGWAVTKFQKNCSGKGATITVIKVGKFVFGGYTNVPWEANPPSKTDEAYRESNQSFIFSLRNNEGLPPFKSLIKPDHTEYAITCCSYCGPTFGAGYDIHITSDVGGSIARFDSYQVPPNVSNAETILAGTKKRFTPIEVEVFYFL